VFGPRGAVDARRGALALGAQATDDLYPLTILGVLVVVDAPVRALLMSGFVGWMVDLPPSSSSCSSRSWGSRSRSASRADPTLLEDDVRHEVEHERHHRGRRDAGSTPCSSRSSSSTNADVQRRAVARVGGGGRAHRGLVRRLGAPRTGSYHPIRTRSSATTIRRLPTRPYPPTDRGEPADPGGTEELYESGRRRAARGPRSSSTTTSSLRSRSVTRARHDRISAAVVPLA